MNEATGRTRITPYTRNQTLRIFCAKRTGKQRYPSEKKKLKSKNKEILSDSKDKDKFEGTWRLFKLAVPLDQDPGKDFLVISDALLQEIAKALKFPVASLLPQEAFTIVRKSFDARKKLKEPKFVHTVDMDAKKLLSLEPRTWDFISRLEPKVGLVEHVLDRRDFGDLRSIIRDCKENKESVVKGENGHSIFSGLSHIQTARKPKIAIVGSGPSGLFASLVLAEFGADVTLIERGQPVEKRGRDIGALVVRRILELESNFCFGEVMRSLVEFGAPKQILIDGKPHLGTDRLVPLLRNFRQHLQELGVTIKFGTRVDDLVIKDGHVLGVTVSESSDRLRSSSQKMEYDAVVLAVGHSARDIYQMLLSHNLDLVPKDFAVGLRIEHPQELINSLQYSELASEVCRGRGKVPVADYKVANYIDKEEFYGYSGSEPANRSCYSFCMCPGGQVVLTSTNPSEMCVNGMSFSRRASRWANAALVVTVTKKDFEALNYHGPLAGVEFQLHLFVPVTSVPPSSYRLGVKAANLHQLFPIHITEALQHSLLSFDKETRTSSPIQIPRDVDSYESTSLKGLYPVGEGAGYAGGIISAAVDGMHAGFAVAKRFGLFHGDLESVLGKAQNVGFLKY
ncbi:hypothetical protein TanjilG_27211 [Lupinus angustifolius]|uniref:Uncharacterized protein n=1 Tax=Lupinus angustifolius TaxID=3871 RepID=A0A1J7H676_LUPAN|nr:hypothetical protein TanjilG_27211 [Lupinus angustifolius]